MKTGIYISGEEVADFLEIPAGSKKFELTLGGSGIFTALGAQAAVRHDGVAAHVSFVGPLSTDDFGNRFFSRLNEAGVDTTRITRVDRKTPAAMVFAQPGQENRFSLYVSGSTAEGTTPKELPQTVNHPDSNGQNIFSISSIITVLSPTRFAWMRFAQQQRHQSVIFHDLNTRPDIAKSPTHYQPVVADWARIAHIMKASDADIAWAYPGKPMEDVAKDWLDKGTKIAVFTAGAKGAYAFTRNHKLFVPSDPLRADRTVGAGDNFNAGLLVKLAQKDCATPAAVSSISRETLEEVLEGGHKAARRHLISMGAQALPRPSA